MVGPVAVVVLDAERRSEVLVYVVLTIDDAKLSSQEGNEQRLFHTYQIPTKMTSPRSSLKEFAMLSLE